MSTRAYAITSPFIGAMEKPASSITFSEETMRKILDVYEVFDPLPEKGKELMLMFPGESLNRGRITRLDESTMLFEVYRRQA